MKVQVYRHIAVIRCYILLLAILFAGTALSQSATITLQTLLKEMIDASSVAKWPVGAPYTMHQASSYDRRSISPGKPGWFANGDFNQFIRSEQIQGRTEYVMMDAEGPGAIVRFWLTTVVKAGTLRFYFDNEEKSSVEIPAYDLLKGNFHLGKALLNPHSSYEPEGKGGNTLYLPLPYQKHCKVTLEFRDTTSQKTSHYYQVNYRTYAPATKVKTFQPADLVNYKSYIDTAENQLWHPPVVNGKNIINKAIIQPNQEMSLPLPAGNAAIRFLSVKIKLNSDADTAQMLRSLWLKINFDGNQTVWCPLSDFSGSGYGMNLVKSWYREMTEDGTIVSRWVMPYRDKAVITLVNTSGLAAEAEVAVVVDKWRWTNASMYFFATYKFEAGIKNAKWDYDVSKMAAHDSTAPIEWNFIEIKGKGIYLGNTLAINNHMQTWYGEGDAKIWVDGDNFPSEFGTGLEDYYNTSWAPVVLYQTPFANAPRADNASSFGHNTFTRTRNLDAVSFTTYFRYDLEMLSWNGGTVDAAATVYWYGAPGAKIIR